MGGFCCFSVCVAVLLIVGVDSHNWNLLQQQRYLQNHLYPQPRQTQRPGYFEVVEGTVDQLNKIDTQWICTNQKTGDMMVIGTEKPGQTVIPQPQQPTYNPQRPLYPQYPQYPQVPQPQYPQVPQPQYPQVPQPQYPQVPQPQNSQNSQPQNPQNSQPQNPQNSQPQNPQNSQPQNPQNSQPQQPEEPQNSGFPDLPWTLLPGATTADPSKKLDNFDWSSYITTAPSTKTPRQSTQYEFDGQGIIEPRFGLRG